MSRSVAETLADLPADLLAETVAQLWPDGPPPSWDWDVWGRPEQIWRPGPETYTVYLAGRGWGKLLCVDTPIPTTKGWKRNGDLQPGDFVYGPDGEPTRVVATFDRVPERAWRVRFSDGTHVDAGGEHLWCTWTHRDRKAWNRGQDCDGPLPERWWDWAKLDQYGKPTGVGPSVRDTDAIVATLAQGSRGDRNHSIPTTAPIVLPAADLPIDPWLLGYWLGNGSSTAATLTCHHDDAALVLAAALARGIDASLGKIPPGKAPTVNLRGVRVKLRALGVLGNKHVPDVYLWASVEQRLALLRGLLDSDGYAEQSKVEFCSTTPALATAVLHLARSLGERPAIYEGRASLNGADYGPKWRVCWRPARHNPFALPRKSAKVSLEHGGQASRLFHRMIVAVEPIPVSPMRCIEVDNDSHLYLAGEGMIPTHNTATGAHAVNYMALHPELCGGSVARGPDDRRAGEGALIGIAGRTANDVNQTMIDGDSGIMASCDPALRPVWNKSEKTLTWSTGVRARLMSGDVPASFRGPNFGGLWADELPHWARAEVSWKECKRAFRKAARGQHRRAVVTTTPLGTEVTRRLVWKHDRDGAPVPVTDKTPDDRRLQGYEVAARTRVVVGSTFDNVANLDGDYLDEIGQYAGTPDAEQEHEAQIRMEVPGAPVRADWFQRCELDEVPELDEMIVAVDPTGSDGERRPRTDLPCECGIVAMGFMRSHRRVYGLADRSKAALPDDWADIVVDLCLGFGITTVVAEQNFGGRMVQSTVLAAYQRRRSLFKAKGLRQPAVVLVKATADKYQRALMSAPAFRAGKIVHAGPSRHWTVLERQWTTLNPNRPIRTQQTDRLDAEGWGILHFLGDGTDRSRVHAYTRAEGWDRVKAALAGAGRR